MAIPKRTGRSKVTKARRVSSSVKKPVITEAGKKKRERSGYLPALRTTVGAKNPYAFVEYTLGVKIDWKHSSPQGVQLLLEKICEKPFSSAFDDIHHIVHTPKSPEKPRLRSRRQKKKEVRRS